MPGAVARLFDAMAGAYEELEPWYEHFYRQLHAIVAAELGPPADGRRGRALDAGCGTGFQTTLLERLGYAAHGLDLSAGLLGVARRRLPRARLVLGDVEALPYGDGSFDAVTCCGSTLSFVPHPARALGELGRVLAPGGRLLLDVEHRWSLDLLWMAASALTRDSLGYGVPARALSRLFTPSADGVAVAYPDYGPLRLFRRGELGVMLRAAGLTPLRAWGLHSVTNVIPSTVLHRPRLSRPLAAAYQALCAVDQALSCFAPARWLANSLVILARKETTSP